MTEKSGCTPVREEEEESLRESTSGAVYTFHTSHTADRARTMDTHNQVFLKESLEQGLHQKAEQLNRASQKDRVVREDPVLTALYEQHRKLQDNQSLLAELARIEQELRESLRREEERQQELEQIRQEQNRQHWRSLCFLSLNQRTAKPWVTSYYKNIPMHIYCLPIETVAHRQKKKKR